MRITCPLCGERDIREFSCQGAATMLERPAPDAGAEVWDDWLHNRANPAGETHELWYHEFGCAAWVVVTRDTVSHAVISTALAADHKGAGA